MSNINQLMRSYVNLKRTDLIDYARISLYILYPACRAEDGDGVACSTIAAVVLSAIHADKEVTDKEKAFLQDVLRIDEKGTEILLSHYTKNMPAEVKKFSRKLSGDLKVEMARLALCIGCSDETITKEEAHYMLDLIE